MSISPFAIVKIFYHLCGTYSTDFSWFDIGEQKKYNVKN